MQGTIKIQWLKQLPELGHLPALGKAEASRDFLLHTLTGAASLGGRWHCLFLLEAAVGSEKAHTVGSELGSKEWGATQAVTPETVVWARPPCRSPCCLTGRSVGDMRAGVWPWCYPVAMGLIGATCSLCLNSFCACFSHRRKAQPPGFCLSVLATCLQNQGISKHSHSSVLGGGNPIYSLIFCMLREAVNDPAEGEATSAAGVQAGCHL